LPNNAASLVTEIGPIGSKLKLERDSGDDTHGERDSENANPETRGSIVLLVSGATMLRL
jgi:hypothetical protein